MLKFVWLLPIFLFVAGWNAVGSWEGGIFTGLLGLTVAGFFEWRGRH